jgi:hypothetical protein
MPKNYEVALKFLENSCTPVLNEVPFIVLYGTVSVLGMQHRRVGSVVNDVERVWKEAVVA